MSNKYLYKFNWDCGRQGELDGLFVATEDEIEGIMGKEIYFGEALGKHSEIYGKMEKKDIKKVDLDSETVEKVAELLGTTWSGLNPFEYLEEEE